MDRFVIKKRRIDDAGSEPSGQSEPGETSESAAGNENCPIVQNVPKNVSKEQQKSTNRKFHEEWENQYLVSEYNDTVICLICRHNFTQIKKFSFERHFDTKHIKFKQEYPLSSEERTDQIKKLKTELESQQKVVKRFFSTNELVSRASFEIAFDIAKKGKPYTDGEFHKSLMQSVTEILCENMDVKQKAPLLDSIKKIPVSHQTVSRRVNDIGAEIEANLKRELEQCEAFSLAL
ncbi:hypothetical protein EON73_03625 [bacterium]|nr:MAG: hypothetical protein EON73_03625 [bacterium]